MFVDKCDERKANTNGQQKFQDDLYKLHSNEETVRVFLSNSSSVMNKSSRGMRAIGSDAYKWIRYEQVASEATKH